MDWKNAILKPMCDDYEWFREHDWKPEDAYHQVVSHSTAGQGTLKDFNKFAEDWEQHHGG